jgi:hypothetical protein
VVVVIVLLLLIVLIYGQTATFYAFAKPPKKGPITCRPIFNMAGTAPYTECCQTTYPSTPGALPKTYCTKCDNTVPPSNCGPAYEVRTANGGPLNPPSTGTLLPPSGNHTGTVTNGPPRLGTVLPPSGNNTSSPGKASIFNPIRNTTNALSGNNNTGTLPPESIIKVPPGTIGSATNPSNNTGTASLGNIIKVPVNHTNALPTGNNSSTPPPALKLSQPSLAGQQPQMQQTTHHHKGSSTGASTSTGNSTGH